MRVCAVLLLVMCVACDDEPEVVEPPAEPVVATPTERRPLPAPRPVAASGAFDLVVTGEGAMLVYGQPVTAGGAIQALPLTRSGTVSGAEQRVAAPSTASVDAVELSAAAGGGRLGVVWVWRAAARRQVVAVLGDDAASAFSPPRVFGDLDDEGSGPRGRVIAAASHAGEVSVGVRGGRTACEDGNSARCHELRVRRLAPASEGRGVPLALPSPCPRTWVGFEHVGASWYYGVCDQQRGTILYAIQFDPEYAHAEPHFQGCDPLGITPYGDGILAMAQCADGAHGVRFGDAGHTVSAIRGTPEVKCVDDRPVIELPGSEFPLEAPRSGMALLLPEAVAGETDRAVWTGEAVLVATTVGGEVGLRRWECSHGQFMQTDAD